MVIDVSQFHQTYLEEASEHLANLEAGLLDFEKNDEGDINAIFRAAHSIKGGAGTFGFDAIAHFTHNVEEVLDKARENEIKMHSDLVNVLLKAVDVLGEMVEAAKNKEELPEGFGADVSKEVAAFLVKDTTEEATLTTGTGKAANKKAKKPEIEAEEPNLQTFAITFKPHPHLLRTGSDPLNIFRELASLGDLQVHVIRENLPKSIETYNPEDVYYTWQLTLKTAVTLPEVKDVFMFVEDDADITYKATKTPLSGEEPQLATEETKTPTPPPLSPEVEAEVVATIEAEVETAELTPFVDRRQTNNRGRRKSDQVQVDTGAAFMRVATEKVDELINLAGEMVTTGAMVHQHIKAIDRDSHEGLYKAVTDMEHYTRSMQQAVMAIRMMPVSFVFNRFPRMVRDTSTQLGKKVDLVTEGESTELDKTVIEKMADPLTHLVRNAIDHGVEPPEERLKVGKNEIATVTLAANYQGGNVVIEVRDDGRGLNRELILKKAREKRLVQEGDNLADEDVWQLIFEPGFSTAAMVTDVSGRGVGMDVVRRNIQSLGGSIRIRSVAGQGSVFTISLPLTLAILDGMAIRAHDAVYIIPILGIIESTRPNAKVIKKLRNNIRVMDFRGQYLPFIRLSDVFSLGKAPPLEEGIAVIVEADNQQFALFVDDLLGERQVVIKSIEKNYRMVEGVSGATILGDGTVSFILDLSGVLRRAVREGLFRQENLSPAVIQQALSLDKEVPHGPTA